MKHLLFSFGLFLFSLNLFSQKLDYKQGEVLFKIANNTNINSVLTELNHSNQIKIESFNLISKNSNIWLGHYNFVLISDKEVLRALNNTKGVIIAQHNHILEYRSTTPNDPQFGSQWQWLNLGDSGLEDADVDADLAWDITTGGVTTNGDTIVVCVVDDGTQLDHPDLTNNLWRNYAEIPGDGIDNDNNGYVDDYYGWNTSGNDNVGDGYHGVEVDGMIGAVGNNGVGVTGINWNVKIMTVVNSGGLDEANVISAYDYALTARKKYNETNGQEGAFVVATNSSWGIDNGNPDDAPLWCSFYDTLGLHGILNCGATANNNVNIDEVGDLPTACASEYMMSVTATNNQDIRTFSAYGVENVDLGAPGENVYTTNSGSGYTNASGTSFASPLVAGVVGLLYSAPCSTIANIALESPAEAAQLVRDYIYAGVDQVPDLDGFVATGGRVNAFNSIQLLIADCGPCPNPFGVSSDNITDISASISWSVNDEIDAVTLRWREEGAPTWNIIENANSPYQLSELTNCTDYEYQLKSNCSGEMTDFSSSYTFKTDGCCEAPTGIIIDETTNESASFSWSYVLAAESYSVHVWNTEFDFTENTADLFSSVDGLEICTEYSLTIGVLCEGGVLITSEPLTFTTNCGNCTDLDYCIPEGNTEDEWIESVIISNIENQSGSNGGYMLFDDAVIFTPGETFTFLLVPGYNSFQYDEYFKIWIDYNQNGIFDDNEVAFDPGFNVSDTITSSLTIPDDAIPGQTRMRIIMSYNANSDLVQPCEDISYGEIEDYCVEMLNGGCSVPNNIDLSVSSNIVDISWDHVYSSIAYHLETKLTTETEWTVTTTTDPAAQLSLLLNNTYELRIKSICEEDISEYSDIITFNTLSGTDDLENQSISIFPSIFTNSITVETKDIKISTCIIYDLNGKEIVEIQPQSQSFTINDLAKLNSGVYFLHLFSENKRYVNKIIKY